MNYEIYLSTNVIKNLNKKIKNKKLEFEFYILYYICKQIKIYKFKP